MHSCASHAQGGRFGAGGPLLPRSFILLFFLLVGEVGSAAGQAWRSTAPMPAPRYGMAAVELGGDIYVIGGRDRYGQPLSTIFRYDPEADFWETDLTPMDSPRVDPAAVVVDGKIYVIGGAVGDDEPVNDVLTYDPATDAWSDSDALQYARHGHQALKFNGRILVAGGRDDASRLVEEVEVFDPIEGTSAVLDDWRLQNPRVSFALVSIADVVYALFGYGSGGPIPAAEQFGPLTDVDEFLLSVLLRGRLATVTVDRTAYLMGGRAEPDDVTDEILLFTPTAEDFLDRWRIGPAMPTPRESFAAVMVAGDIYAIGGRTQDGTRDGVALRSVDVLSVSTKAETRTQAQVQGFGLEQNHPNPFTNSTAIPFMLSGETSDRVTLQVYDLQGRLVDTVVDKALAPGRHEVTWRAKAWPALTSGAYFYVLRQGENRQIRQMTHIR